MHFATGQHFEHKIATEVFDIVRDKTGLCVQPAMPSEWIPFQLRRVSLQKHRFEHMLLFPQVFCFWWIGFSLFSLIIYLGTDPFHWFLPIGISFFVRFGKRMNFKFAVCARIANGKKHKNAVCFSVGGILNQGGWQNNNSFCVWWLQDALTKKNACFTQKSRCFRITHCSPHRNRH